jgi:hypothetical protein
VKTRQRSPLFLRIFIGVLLLALVVTLVTSFTAQVNVPASNAGVMHEPLSISQLAPPECSALTLTSLVKITGNYTNTKSHVLILGGADVNSLTDSGADNCIVHGGGNFNVNAQTSSICIKGPGTVPNDYHGCVLSS